MDQSDHRPLGRRLAAPAVACTVLAACGGGGGGGDPVPPALDNTVRSQAAATTAQNNGACTAIRPFYWEIGSQAGALASGSLEPAASPAGAVTYTATTLMAIASASKWLYGGYVAQARGAAGLSADDIKFLTFRSGYTNFSICLQNDTVDSCLARGTNGLYTPATDGKFFYDGGHMQKHASLAGLGAMDNAALSAAVRGQVGADVNLAYTQPQAAGGVASTASDYARYLRKLLSGQLRMSQLLGSNAVCTNPTTCGGTAIAAPIPQTESWHYSIGHWVEDDPVVGDGAFSSPGAFGFYPWIDASRTWYGVLARRGDAGTGIDSVLCGRQIRKAWVTGAAQ